MPVPGALFNTLGITGSPTGKSVGLIPDPALASDNQFGLYVFTDTKNEGTDILFFYGKPKTAAEMKTPFRSTTRMGNHRWPPILLGINIIEDYGAPRTFTVIAFNEADEPVQGVGVGPTYYDQVVYIPDVAEGTRFVKDEYTSAVPWSLGNKPVPVPTAVSYLLPGGIQGNFPECLHDDITIPATTTCQLQVVAGISSNVGTTVGEQRFPATNFLGWAPYVLSDTQELVNGIWYRVRIRVFPPPQPDAITSAN